MDKWFLPDMHYQVAFFDYGSECEVRVYPSAFACPGYGRPTDCTSKYRDDEYIESFELNRYGEYTDILVHDLDELEARAQRSRQVSISRTVNKVYAIARGYDWEWFCTFTFSPEEVDRYDYSAVSALMVKWLDTCRHQSDNMQYIVVPELHKDGAFHFHGLFSRCASALRLSHFKGLVYNIGSFSHGYSTATAVSRPDAASCYISKYITKDMCAVTKGKRRYWASRNVSAPEPVRCKMSVDERRRLCSMLRPYASYVSTAVCSISRSGVEEIQYFHFNKADFPDDIMQFLKLHQIG